MGHTELRTNQVKNINPSSNNHIVTINTGLGRSIAEIVPGVRLKTKRPKPWARFWIWFFFGVSFSKE